MTARVTTADRGRTVREEADVDEPVQISAAAAAAIAVRPIPMEAARAGAMVAAEIALKRAEAIEDTSGPTRSSARWRNRVKDSA